MVTLTHVPRGGVQKVRDAWKGFTRRLKRMGHAIQWCWAMETNPGDEDDAHLHALVHGIGDLDLPTVQETAEINGFGEVADLTRFRDAKHRRNGANYILKTVTRTAPYTTTAAKAIFHHLDLNGSRPEHHSRGFFPGPLSNVTTATYTINETEGEWRRIA